MVILTGYTYARAYYAEAAARFHDAVPGALVRAYRDRGSWLENCRRKPYLIHEEWQPDRPVLWIDVDNRVDDLPAAPADFVDFAAVPSKVPDRDWWAGVLWFGPTEGARNLLLLWIAQVVEHEDWSDERALNAAFREVKGSLVWDTLHAPGIGKGLSGNASRHNRGEAV